MFLNVKLFKDIFVVFLSYSITEKSRNVCASVAFLFPGALFCFFDERNLVIYVWKMIYRNLRM